MAVLLQLVSRQKGENSKQHNCNFHPPRSSQGWNVQVNWARAALQGLQSIGSPGTRGADANDALSWQMSHCVMQLHTFVMDSLMHTALPQLSQVPLLLSS